MVTCLTGFMGILCFIGTIILSNRPLYSSLFTPSQVRLDVRPSAWYSSLFTFHFPNGTSNLPASNREESVKP